MSLKINSLIKVSVRETFACWKFWTLFEWNWCTVELCVRRNKVLSQIANKNGLYNNLQEDVTEQFEIRSTPFRLDCR